jgi:hypothetical protein
MGGDGCTWELAPVGWPFPAGDVENPAPAADVTAVAWHAGGIFNWVEEVVEFHHGYSPILSWDHEQPKLGSDWGLTWQKSVIIRWVSGRHIFRTVCCNVVDFFTFSGWNHSSSSIILAEVASIPSIPEASIPEADIPPMDSNYSAKSVPIQAAWTWRLVAGDKSGNIWS